MATGEVEVVSEDFVRDFPILGLLDVAHPLIQVKVAQGVLFHRSVLSAPNLSDLDLHSWHAAR